jgi:hypothetical protein
MSHSATVSARARKLARNVSKSFELYPTIIANVRASIVWVGADVSASYAFNNKTFDNLRCNSVNFPLM